MPAELSRRSFLTALGAGAMAATAGPTLAASAAPALPTAAAAGATVAVPATLAARGRGAGLVRPGFAIDHLAVRWTGPQAPVLRFPGAAGALGEWGLVAETCEAAAGDSASTSEGVALALDTRAAPLTVGAALVPAGGATAYELEPSTSPAVEVVALNTTSGPASTRTLRAADQRTSMAGRTYLSRARWGADESLRFDAGGAESFPQTYWPVQTLTVHHTATANDDPDPAATLRAIYFDHTIVRDFGDIGYHLLIDELGRVYEGRYSGTDAIPGHDLEGRMVNAAHTGGFNAGNVGVALLGTFTDRLPTAAARRTLVRVLATLAEWHGIDPQSPVNYVNPISGSTRTVLGVAGHRDWLATECPGDLFAPELDAVRADVATLLDAYPIAPPMT